MSEPALSSTGRRRRRLFRRGPRATAPLGTHALSIYDPVLFGIDEDGRRVAVTLIYRNLLIGGEPGAGKSSLLNTVIAHAALATDCQLWLFDGKRVELGLWRRVARVFVGNDITFALDRLRALQREMDARYAQLDAALRRKIDRIDGLPVMLCAIDELAYFSVTIGSKDQQEEFKTLVRDLVARGRAAGIIVVAATQRPSADIIPTSLRDLFGYRVAFRCTTDSSSDIILSVGWAGEGFSAKAIPPDDAYRGVGFLLAEGGIPRRFKAAYLDDDQITAVITHALRIRHRPAG
jgi:DNA segregation ATPase FtsK/SpoIIIE, S-DNA-T family